MRILSAKPARDQNGPPIPQRLAKSLSLLFPHLQHKRSVISRGSATNAESRSRHTMVVRVLKGHSSPTRGGTYIDSQHMDKILKVRKDHLDATVQPAVGWESLNEEHSQMGITGRRTFPRGFVLPTRFRARR